MLNWINCDRVTMSPIHTNTKPSHASDSLISGIYIPYILKQGKVSE